MVSLLTLGLLLSRVVQVQLVDLGPERGFQIGIQGANNLQIGVGLAVGRHSLSFGGGVVQLEGMARMLGVSLTRCSLTISTADDGVIADWCVRSLTRLGDIREFIR